MPILTVARPTASGRCPRCRAMLCREWGVRDEASCPCCGFVAYPARVLYSSVAAAEDYARMGLLHRWANVW